MSTVSDQRSEHAAGAPGANSGYYDLLAERNLAALWTKPEVLTPEPVSQVQPYLWDWEVVRPILMDAGDAVSPEEAERRVLLLVNPGLVPRPGTTQSLVAGLQLVMPGEIAITHRHTPAALRFIMEGVGGFTTVNGERTLMEPGDFITTPNWTWHDHGNETGQPSIWLDGLDVPVALAMSQIFYEEYEADTQGLSRPVDDSYLRYGSNLLPVDDSFGGSYSPLLNYKWERTREALAGLSGGPASPYDGVRLQYVNPRTGGPVLPTMGAYAQLLRGGETTASHRHTSSTIYMVQEGTGYSIIDGQRFDWAPKDTFVVPTWSWHQHGNSSASQDAVLFSFDDRPMLTALDWYREEARE